MTLVTLGVGGRVTGGVRRGPNSARPGTVVRRAGDSDTRRARTTPSYQ